MCNHPTDSSCISIVQTLAPFLSDSKKKVKKKILIRRLNTSISIFAQFRVIVELNLHLFRVLLKWSASSTLTLTLVLTCVLSCSIACVAH